MRGYIASWVGCLVVLIIALFLMGCSVISSSDMKMLKEVLGSNSGCAYIQGSGGGGAITPLVPMGGGYGQGSLSIARSSNSDAKIECNKEGASVENEDL